MVKGSGTGSRLTFHGGGWGREGGGGRKLQKSTREVFFISRLVPVSWGILFIFTFSFSVLIFFHQFSFDLFLHFICIFLHVYIYSFFTLFLLVYVRVVCVLSLQDKAEDIQTLVDSFTAPALASALRDRETALHICARLLEKVCICVCVILRCVRILAPGEPTSLWTPMPLKVAPSVGSS